MKSIRSILLTSLLCIIPFALSGQRYISGRITDAEDGEALISASVFIANTTSGTTTDTEGNYKLKIQGEGSYRLTISYTGYQSVFEDIEPGDASVVFDVAMKPVTILLEEATVVAKARFRQTDINFFWRTLLGKPPSKKTIYAVNPEDVFYNYNSETKLLRVTCRVPLQIVNNETGYHIQLILDHFTHDYSTNITSWKYEHLFRELEPENNKQKTAWEINRKKAYRVSLTNFIKSMYNNTLIENGFLLTYPQRMDASNHLRNSYETADIFVSANPLTGGKMLHIPTGLKDLMLICFEHTIDKRSLDDVEKAQDNLFKWSNIGSFRNMLQTPGGSVPIFSDGTYSNSLMLTPCYFSKPLSGLNLKLPVDYIPDADSKVPDTDVVFSENTLSKRFEQQLEVFPQEKIHLHTDRDIYVPGEKIWFKAYLVDACSHFHTTLSRYVYVELISPVDTLVSRIMVRPTDNMFFGYLPLTEIVPEGDYTIRAYTRYMENLGDDYFFKKNIKIENLSAAKSQEQKPNPGSRDDFDVSFFPEGGNLPEGVNAKVAFKALNRNGNPEAITGKLIDEAGVEITTVESFYAGMGILNYIPEQGKRIYLKCRNTNGLEKQFELPQPDRQAYSLTASMAGGEKLLIGVQQSIHAPELSGYLLAHCRGLVLYFSEWDRKQELISFNVEEFPAGVIQFVLFDGQMNPLSERLVFCKNQNVEQVDFQTDRTVYEKREKVITTLSMKDNPSGVHFSVAITDDRDAALDASATILSSLLLSSELRGYIENPAYYLQDTEESAFALDCLMMTHGWRRYNTAEVVKGRFGHPQIPRQMDQELSGRVTNGLFNRSVNEGKVNLLTRGVAMLSATDKNGMFAFQDLEFPDSTVFYIQASDKKGNTRVKLAMKETPFPVLTRAPKSLPSVSFPVAESVETGAATGAFMEKAEQRAKYNDGIRMIHLPEVEITVKPNIKKDEPRLEFWANSSSDVTLTRELFDKWNATYVSEYLNTVAGVHVFPNGDIVIRGASGPPLVIIDGMVVQETQEVREAREAQRQKTLSYDEEPQSPLNPGSRWESPIERVAINDIESIDIFKGPSAAIFGSRGANGVISITTRRGRDTVDKSIKTNSTVYSPLGYQKPVEFYSPRYETGEAKQSTVPDYRTTIFWKPDIVILDDQQEATFEFYTSDFPTTYSVVIEGLSNEGGIIRQVEKIRVE